MDASIKKRVAQALLQIDAVGFTPQRPVTFKSGLVSPVYVDNRRLPYHPQAWRTVVEGFQHLIRSHDLSYDLLASVELGGVPHASVLAYLLAAGSVIIRKDAKEHGTRRLIEGGDVNGRRVLLIEDLVTTGGSSLRAISLLRAEGAIAGDLLAIVSYGFEEATTALHAAEVRLHTLTDFTTILTEVKAQQRHSPAEIALIEDWFHDPYDWAERHINQ